MPLDHQGLADDVEDGHARVERAEGVLEHELQRAVGNSVIILPLEGEHVDGLALVVVGDLAGSRGAARPAASCSAWSCRSRSRPPAPGHSPRSIGEAHPRRLPLTRVAPPRAEKKTVLADLERTWSADRPSAGGPSLRRAGCAPPSDRARPRRGGSPESETSRSPGFHVETRATARKERLEVRVLGPRGRCPRCCRSRRPAPWYINHELSFGRPLATTPRSWVISSTAMSSSRLEVVDQLQESAP